MTEIRIIFPEEPQRLLLVGSGSRHLRDYRRVCTHLDKVTGGYEVVAVFHGGCRGADMLIDRWARARGHEVVVFKADWDKHGKAAGPIRNGEMLLDAGLWHFDEFCCAEPGKVICVAFPLRGSRGTVDFLRQARRSECKNFEVVEVKQ